MLCCRAGLTSGVLLELTEEVLQDPFPVRKISIPVGGQVAAVAIGTFQYLGKTNFIYAAHFVYKDYSAWFT